MELGTRSDPVQGGSPDAGVDHEKQIYDLKQLLEISKSLNSTLDYNILIDSILFTCMAQLKVVKAGLFARKCIDSDVFVLNRNYKGFEIDRRSDYGIPEDHGIIKLFSRKYACYTPDAVRREIGSIEGLEAIEALEPSLYIPLKAKGQVNGVIILGERIDDSDFDAYELDYILNLAILAAIAINNAFLFEMTTTDMMTKLKMKHYFFTVLMERLEAGAAQKQRPGIIMLDIDHFKNINDTYGHSCGDAVLKRVAHTVMDSLRPIDIAARYGGEEFVCLISNAAKELILSIAERIRQAVEGMETEYEGMKLRVTLSAGAACFRPESDFTAKNLVDRADRALYRSKQGGRNRVSYMD